MKNKQGFSLITTLIVMVFVFSITSVMLMVLGGQSRNLKSEILIFEKRQEVLQITINFVDMSEHDFADYYLNNGYTLSQEANTTSLYSQEKNMRIEINLEAYSSTMQLKTCQEGNLLAKVVLQNGEVKDWQIFMEEI